MGSVNVISNKGKWAPGVSPNPRGRPKGAPNKKPQIPAELTADAIAQLTKLVAEGDQASIKMVLDRSIACLRPITTPGSLDAELLSMRIKELGELEARIEQLEAMAEAEERGVKRL